MKLDPDTRKLVSSYYRVQRENRLAYFEPYEWQKQFLAASRKNSQVLLMAGNRVGKSYVGAMCGAYHLTGRYPKWWEGRAFRRPVVFWACGVKVEKVRDVNQALLFGAPDDPSQFGTGAVPKSAIGKAVRKPNVPNAWQSVGVRHVRSKSQMSRCAFRAYEMGAESFMSESVDVIWLDEEPPYDVYSQALVRVLDRKGFVYMTFTPENGMTEVVRDLVDRAKPGQVVIRAGWDDAPHLDAEAKEQILAAIPEHERLARSTGQPGMGSGLVFPYPQEEVSTPRIEIPRYWKRIAGMDFGMGHPTAVAWVAINPDNGYKVVYDCYRSERATLADHAYAIRQRGEAPIAWPHDGMVQDRNSGIGIAQLYRDMGLMMLESHFTNPDGGFAVNPGIVYMAQEFATGQLKVFEDLADWFEEYRAYHFKDGKIVKIRDDLMSATRYAVMSQRFARSDEPMDRRLQRVAVSTPEDEWRI